MSKAIAITFTESGTRVVAQLQESQAPVSCAAVMISASVETIAQQKLHPGLCAVNPTKPLKYGEKAYLLPRGDVVFKSWVDQWMHLAKATGDYDRVVEHWLK